MFREEILYGGFSFQETQGERRGSFSRLWLIPKDAEKPADARTKAGRTKKHE